MSTPSSTVYVITHGQRGEEEVGILSVHATHAGAVAAIHAWVLDNFEADTVEAIYEEHDMDPEEGDICTEDDMLTIVEEEVQTP